MPTDPTSEMPALWRVGRKVALNVYEGDRPAFQCHTPEEAARVVGLLNAALKQPVLTREQIMGAVARGWCHRQAASTIMDPVLAATITSEVMKLLEVED